MVNKIAQKKVEIAIIIVFFLFSWWLMDKSFGYNKISRQFRIARHQVGDFGLHLSLIRSFSFGNNIPPELPFYPKKPLPYHFFFDFIVGTLERIGVPIDLAFNTVSAFFFSLLLFLIYKLPQKIFHTDILLGIISVLLFLFQGGFAFVGFFKDKPFSFDLIKYWWNIPDYIFKGPFDGSVFSIFFTLNVYLNQRHLIAALAFSFLILFHLLPKLLRSKRNSVYYFIIIGLLLGLTSRLHSLVFVASMMVFSLMLILFKKWRYLLFLILPAFVVFSPHLLTILTQREEYPFINLGFLAQKPLTLVSFLNFWLLNAGANLFTSIAGFLMANQRQRKIYIAFFLLFVVGNIFQFSTRIEHNHTLFNYFFIVANWYSAYFLLRLLKSPLAIKIAGFLFFFLLILSGVINMMAIKNDFQLYVDDAPTDSFMHWITTKTDPKSVFLSPQEILDPITLSGRRNYFGHKYYLSVMGYNFSERELLTKEFFEVDNPVTIEKMKEEGIQYLVVPLEEKADFHYDIKEVFLQTSLRTVYEDDKRRVFKL